MSAISEMDKWLATLKPSKAEKGIVKRIIAMCRNLNKQDSHIKMIMHKSGLTQ